MMIATRVMLNLRRFGFKGASAYGKVLLPRKATPLLEKLQIFFFNRLTFFVPRLQQVIGAAENLRFSRAKLMFPTGALPRGYIPSKGPGFMLSTCMLHVGTLTGRWRLQHRSSISSGQ
jgi:hypothetical protein